MLRSVILYSLFACVLYTGCTSKQNQEDTSSKDAYGEYEIADPPASKADARVHVIEIKQMKFEPEVLNVHKGDKVIWVNKDIVEHDVTESSKAWASAKLPAGASWELTITKSEAYYCNLHVVMKGKVIVDGAKISMLDDASGITICR
jgi:plastocyanin